VRRIALALVLLVLAGCGGDERITDFPTIDTSVPIIGNACRDGASPHTPAEVVAALGKHGIAALAASECEDGQRMVNGLLGDGLAGEKNAVYCFLAATPATYRVRRLFSDQLRHDNVLCNTISVRMHKRVAAALRELPG
jgi:hypothetical protein